MASVLSPIAGSEISATPLNVREEPYIVEKQDSTQQRKREKVIDPSPNICTSPNEATKSGKIASGTKNNFPSSFGRPNDASDS